jgi:hypothetical protein
MKTAAQGARAEPRTSSMPVAAGREPVAEPVRTLALIRADAAVRLSELLVAPERALVVPAGHTEERRRSEGVAEPVRSLRAGAAV